MNHNVLETNSEKSHRGGAQGPLTRAILLVLKGPVAICVAFNAFRTKSPAVRYPGGWRGIPLEKMSLDFRPHPLLGIPRGPENGMWTPRAGRP